MTHACILLAHGSSDPRWSEPFQQLLIAIRQQLSSEQANRVELAYMELSQPSLTHQINTLVAQGVTDINILPLFFAAGRHLRQDVPQQLEQLKQELKSQGKSVTLMLDSPVGLAPEVNQAICQVVLQQLDQ